MPDAAPEVDAGVRIASSAASAGLGDAVDEARIAAAAAAAVLRCVVDARGPAADVEAAKADADAARAAAEAAAAAAAAPVPVAAATEAAATAAAPTEAAAAAPAAGAAVASAVAAAAPAPGRARASDAPRSSKGSKDGEGGEAVARRAFVESAFAQADAGATLDGRGLAAPGYADDADDIAGSDVGRAAEAGAAAAAIRTALVAGVVAATGEAPASFCPLGPRGPRDARRRVFDAEPLAARLQRAGRGMRLCTELGDVSEFHAAARYALASCPPNAPAGLCELFIFTGGSATPPACPDAFARLG